MTQALADRHELEKKVTSTCGTGKHTGISTDALKLKT